MELVIVSGAGQGIGRAISIELGKCGISILCISKSNNCVKTTEEIIQNGGKAESLILDIENYNETEKKISNWISSSSYKRIGVVLAAAILGPKGPIAASSLENWHKTFKVNLLGNIAILRGILPRMLKNKFGRIITFAGGGSAYAFPIFPAYSASKTAIVRTTENINEDLKGKGDFAVVCLAPGAVQTKMLDEVSQSGAEVRTIVDISEPINFVKEFINSKTCGFSGSLIHVRDNWKNYLNTSFELKNSSMWKLRRIE